MRPQWEHPFQSQKENRNSKSCSVQSWMQMHCGQNVTAEYFIPTLPRQNRFGGFAVETRDVALWGWVACVRKSTLLPRNLQTCFFFPPLISKERSGCRQRFLGLHVLFRNMCTVVFYYIGLHFKHCCWVKCSGIPMSAWKKPKICLTSTEVIKCLIKQFPSLAIGD